MIDKLSGYVPGGLQEPNVRTAEPRAVQAAKAKTASVPSASDKPAAAADTELAGMVGKLLQQGPPVDAARVAELRGAIADGSYRVDANAIAALMLRTETSG